ncbi:MAG: SDR family oxidoreductase [Actinomycetota bacterium]|nr:MAG: short-chain dehydrogenase/reductase [Actinomycetota bacterium]MDO8950783.1 SDR family oxidoreductase [Actinomycetota bacterium]MDP3629704.1 SDR family oxidoreductase [Actinomycetota bacterium]
MRVDGCTALVTGGSSGIGLAAAELLAARGARVALLARDPERLAVAVNAVRSHATDASQQVLAISCDVSDRGQVVAAVREAEATLGPIDLLLNCAGYCTPGRFLELSEDEVERQIRVNLLGTINPTRAVVLGMVKRGRGHIANVASMGGYLGVYGYSGYSPAKFGVMGFSEVLRSEMCPHGVGVSVMCPPNVETPGYAREMTLEPEETAKINGSVKAASPQAMARVLLRAIERDRYYVLPGLVNKLAFRLKGLVPEVFFYLFDRDVAAVRRDTAGSNHVS